ncbi:Flp family type IVb pilin [Achromobacter spanius]|uniref:Flp family type IVb pilin n=1 Tax=Achromobacter spanius TaxID=217203 RepID=UPI0022264DB7|nr:Flp family type IVb pilin [Achromobacter spanius]MCW3152087.1 Flp family type IVb pilin [Achromobacter spanius]
MKAKLAQFWNDEDGITALEYGLIAGLVAVALIAAVGTFTDALGNMFTGLGDKLDTAGGTAGG